ncbi:helix-turn-helix domain-containing protein [Streptomyces camelliae]|uniref:Helix-turn-helix transcriptional regulator n=1 Tax=Streptomyces camelliae TaxID=3004093 RepID=A0ABY7PII1_9ACTN|nr:helix-turn-helix transcriptional regulator [Streptomyces sp. HUAS 2-6]WBO69582.1 helix-turn-helix transcriptional regulator [Streptomyces sp. HUAS 2-6]
MGIFARDDDRTEWAASQVARQATASLAGLLAGLGKSRSDLAKAMGVSPGRVSQILSGDANLTVRTLAAVAEALDADVQISFRPRSEAAAGRSGTESSAAAIGSVGFPAHK